MSGQPQLLLTPVTIHAIKGLASRARPISHETLALRKVKFEDHRLHVPHGYTLTYSHGYYRPKWLCRHMQLSGPSKWPGMAETRRVMQLVGFISSLEECYSWYETKGDRNVVHLLEPVDGRDWSPLRSS